MDDKKIQAHLRMMKIFFCLSSKKWKQFSKCSAATSMFVMLKNKAYRRSGMHAIILIVFFCK
jgi:hypothetical protein